MMKSYRRRQVALPFAAAASLLTIGVPDARAQNLLDMLFGGNMRPQQERYYRVEEPVRQQQPRQAVPVARVQGPTYRDYKADSLVAVDFSRIKGVQLASIEPASIDSDFADALSGLADYELRAERAIAEAVAAHYAKNPKFVWVEEGAPSLKGIEAIRLLGEAHLHGLEPGDYAVSFPESDAVDAERRAATLMRFEMALSARVLRYVADANGGLIDPNRISGYYDFKPKEIDLAAVLAQLSATDDVASLIEGYHPRHPAYASLKAELAVLRASEENSIVVDPRLLLRPGGKSSELPKLIKLIERDADGAIRERFSAVLAAHRDSEAYSQELVDLVKAVQTSLGLQSDGIIGPRTVAALAGDSKADRLVKVKVAMEQLRWHPGDFGARHVFLNTPSFDARYIEDGQERLSMRTVVGKGATQTYFFHDMISYVEFHPYWGMPRSILVNTYISRLRNDPSYFDRNGFELVNSRGQTISSTAVDWYSVGANPGFDVRQRPGPKNALGEMKIMFPNRHAIYMHDTPEKHLFSRDNRAQSNGCIRLEDPRAMAAAVLGWSRSQVDQRIAGQHGRNNLDQKIPVYVAYFTAWPNAAGQVEYFGDVYERDPRIMRALEVTRGVRSAAS